MLARFRFLSKGKLKPFDGKVWQRYLHLLEDDIRICSVWPSDGGHIIFLEHRHEKEKPSQLSILVISGFRAPCHRAGAG